MYDSIVEAVIDAYECDDVWTYEDEVRTTIKDCLYEDEVKNYTERNHQK